MKKFASFLAVVGIGLMVCCGFPGQASAANLRFNGASTTDAHEWNDATNWVGGVLPTTADVLQLNSNNNAGVNGDLTINLSSAQSAGELMVGFPNGSMSTFIPGNTTVNIKPGAALTIDGTSISNSGGLRIGRALTGTVDREAGIVNQTGGAVNILGNTGGTPSNNGLRLSSGDSGPAESDSLYTISGGSLVAGASDASVNGLLWLGGFNRSGGTVGSPLNLQYNSAEFHVVGSAATSIHFDDVVMSASTGIGPQSGVTAKTQFHFTLDAGGVTPINANDEFRFNGTGANKLVIDLAAPAPLSNITLFKADRITTTEGANAFFDGLPEGAAVTASVGVYTYNWTIDYIATSTDDGIQDSFINLDFISRTGGTPPNPGDVNLDGIVNQLDLNVINGHWLASGQARATGDLNGDGLVNQLDLNLVNGNWLGTGGTGSFAAVPEPSTLVLAGFGAAAIGLVGLRRKKAA